MRLWAALYLAIWVVFLEFLLAMIPFAQPLLTYLHAGLGVVIVALAYSNYANLRQTTVPGRLKRVSQVTLALAVLVVVLGPLLLFNVGAGWSVVGAITVWNLLLFVHVVNAFAVLTQMAAVAVAYDMWEEKEFLEETRPGEIPRNPSSRPAKPAR